MSGGEGGLVERPRVLSVGRLIDQKGHRYLLQAFPAVRRAFPQAELTIAGSGWLEPELRQLANDLGVVDCVHFLGQRSDVPDLLRAADVFAFPSLYEGLPGALVEAMLSGCAVVASDLPVTRELIKDGIHGRLVRPTSVPGLVHAICQLLEAKPLRLQLGAAAQNRARKRFEINMVTRQMESLYDSVIQSSRRKRPIPPSRGDRL
jgi:glycosyltransferase involved in cell wall biosynthesis